MGSSDGKSRDEMGISQRRNSRAAGSGHYIASLALSPSPMGRGGRREDPEGDPGSSQSSPRPQC